MLLRPAILADKTERKKQSKNMNKQNNEAILLGKEGFRDKRIASMLSVLCHMWRMQIKHLIIILYYAFTTISEVKSHKSLSCNLRIETLIAGYVPIIRHPLKGKPPWQGRVQLCKGSSRKC